MDEELDELYNDDSFECPQGIDNEERKLLLQKIVDGQANSKEAIYFYSTMDDCEHCQCKNLCEQHLEIKTILKEKLIPMPMPSGLLERIKGKISGSI
jgi:hypothetical protein